MKGNSVDIYVEKGEKIGIEMAMSAKGKAENTKKNLHLNFDHLVVAWKDERTMRDIGV